MPLRARAEDVAAPEVLARLAVVGVGVLHKRPQPHDKAGQRRRVPVRHLGAVQSHALIGVGHADAHHPRAVRLARRGRLNGVKPLGLDLIVQRLVLILVVADVLV